MNRNVIIDIAKYVAAILVVAIHTSPFKNVSPEINFFFCNIVCRFAVPFFAVCTGFYISSIGEEKGFYKAAKRSLYKIGKLYIFWSLIYLIPLIVTWKKTGSEITWLSYISWMKGAVVSFSFYHLWYLIAMCYGLCFFIIVKRFIPERLFILIIIVLWILYICYVYDDSFHVLPIFIRILIHSFPSIFSGFTMMLPLLLVGEYINKYKSYILSKHFLIGGLFISILGLIMEVYFLRNIGGEKYSFVLFTLPSSFFTFFYLYRAGKKLNKVYSFSKTIASISFIIYCIHPMIISILADKDITDPLDLFVLTSVISTALSLVYILIKYNLQRIKR